jgi:hypothetical protein
MPSKQFSLVSNQRCRRIAKSCCTWDASHNHYDTTFTAAKWVWIKMIDSASIKRPHTVRSGMTAASKVTAKTV